MIFSLKVVEKGHPMDFFAHIKYSNFNRIGVFLTNYGHDDRGLCMKKFKRMTFLSPKLVKSRETILAKVSIFVCILDIKA